MINKNRIDLRNVISSQMASILNTTQGNGAVLPEGMGYGGVGTLTIRSDATDQEFTAYSEEFILSGVDKGVFIFDVTPLIVDHMWALGFASLIFQSLAYVFVTQMFVDDDWKFVILWTDGEHSLSYVVPAPVPVAFEKYRVWFEFNHNAPTPESIGEDPVRGSCKVTIERVSNGVKDQATAVIPEMTEPLLPSYLNFAVMVESTQSLRILQFQTKKFLAEGDTPLPFLG